jgi:DUF971 family protein
MFPVEFHLRESDSLLEVVWNDGHRHAFALRYLRGWCPCAKCQGHFTGKRVFIDRVSTRLENIEPVGAYGMKPYWADGHSSGIYAFDYLLELENGPPGDGPSNAECLGTAGNA